MDNQVIQFTTIKEFAEEYNLGYVSMRALVKKYFPKRKRGLLKPFEVKGLKTYLDTGSDEHLKRKSK